jgi:hypothetical protein
VHYFFRLSQNSSGGSGLCQDVLEYVSMYYKKFMMYTYVLQVHAGQCTKADFYVLILAMRCFTDSSMEVKNVYPTKFLLYPN